MKIVYINYQMYLPKIGCTTFKMSQKTKLSFQYWKCFYKKENRKYRNELQLKQILIKNIFWIITKCDNDRIQLPICILKQLVSIDSSLF